MRKTLLLAALAGALLLAGCGPGGTVSAPAASVPADVSAPGPEETAIPIPFTLAAYPAQSFHPALAESAANLDLAPLLYEGLFTLDSRFQPQPLLCQSYFVSADGLVWTFHLREGITFSDGTPLTGEIAAQALRTAQDPASRYAVRLAGASIRGEGNQVTITLSQPNGALPQLLDIPIFLGEGDRPLGTGPYVLAESGGQLSLTARPDWREGADSLPVQEILLESMTRSDEQMPAFNAGEITLLNADLTGDSALGSSGRYQVWDYNTTGLLYLGFNDRQGLCRDPAVRLAVARSVDREDLADAVFARHAVPAALPVHPDSPWYDGELAEELAYDPGALAGLDLEGRPVTLLVNIEDTAKSAAATWIAQELEAAGLVAEVNRLPWAEYLDALEKGRFDLYLGEVFLTPDFDLTPLLGVNGGLNYGGWTTPLSEGLLSAFRSAQGELKPASASALYRHLCQQVPIAPLCFQNGTVLTQYGRAEGLAPVYGNLFAGLENWEIS